MKYQKLDFEILNSFLGYGSFEAEYVLYGLEEKTFEALDEIEQKLEYNLLNIMKKKFLKNKEKSSEMGYTLDEIDFTKFYEDPHIKKLYQCYANNNAFYKKLLYPHPA